MQTPVAFMDHVWVNNINSNFIFLTLVRKKEFAI